MNGKASKQTYLGRVIWPAEFHEGRNGGKGFLTFDIMVDGVAVAQDKTKLSARIPCSYTVQSATDPVATVLCNIATKDDPSANLAGYSYKTVDVVVEGSEKLTQVLVDGKPVSKAYYKALEYCQVTIADKQVLAAYYESIKEEASDEAPPSRSQAPTQAPVERKSAAKQTAKPTPPPAPEVEEEAPAPRKTSYKAGDRVTSDGTEYEYVSGNPEDITSWKEVLPEPPPPPPAKEIKLPFGKKTLNTATAKTAGPVKTPTRKLLEDADGMNQPSPFDSEEPNL
jgi:hypothetical protein